MLVISSVSAMQRHSAVWVRSGEKVGFVPTMGALHEGHLTLIRRARAECNRVIVSIYVNPTQFGPREDLARYPRPRREDLALCRKAGVDVVFAPGNLYLPEHSTWVEETAQSQGREGASRPGHFRGVATVVLKLFNLVRPSIAYFGQKDAQQVDVIQRMVRDLDVPVKITVVETVRDPDGLAMSSRNRYLSVEERRVALEFARHLRHAAKHEADPQGWLRHHLLGVAGLKVDHVTLSGNRLCAAVYVGKTRLIDNEQVLGMMDVGLMIQTRSGRNCTYIFTYTKEKFTGYGTYSGTCQIVGEPGKHAAETRQLVRTLKKYKGSTARPFTLTITEHAREYTIHTKGQPDLHFKIGLKPAGSFGTLYEGKKAIGRVSLYQSEDKPGIKTISAFPDYQRGSHDIRVLLPDGYSRKNKYRVLYVLPVTGRPIAEFGDPLEILRAMDAHNRYQLIIVQMDFEKEPWFGDHVSDPHMRQASLIKEYIVPMIEKDYSTFRSPEARLLLGFSKSGWGAFSLIFTYPEFFGYAASWDAPLMLDDFILAMKSVYGTRAQLDRYRPALLIPQKKAHFQKRTRLVLSGENGWGSSVPAPGGGSHTVEAHRLLQKEGIPHVYNNRLKVPHRWDAQWLEPVLAELMKLPRPL